MSAGYGKFRLISLFAETHIHTGSGEADMSVDLPVIRETTTDFPYVPGSSLKGALRYAATRHWGSDSCFEVEVPFGRGGSGEEGSAGVIIVSDARLLLLPIRSLDSGFYWCTSPLILARLCRDMKRAGIGCQMPSVSVPPSQPLSATAGRIYLEDLSFSAVSSPSHAEIARELALFLPNDPLYRDLVEKRLVILNDDDFKWFARYGLPTRARNSLELGTKTVKDGALWYEECIPPEAVFTLVLGERVEMGASDLTKRAMNGYGEAKAFHRGLYEELVEPIFTRGEGRYIQVGGNETVGHGWFSLSEIGGGA